MPYLRTGLFADHVYVHVLRKRKPVVDDYERDRNGEER